MYMAVFYNAFRHGYGTFFVMNHTSENTSLKTNRNIEQLILFIPGIIWMISGCTKDDPEIYSWQPVEMNDGLQISAASEQGVERCAACSF
jgi:hypothetical protein